jgi:hypothetical protein
VVLRISERISHDKHIRMLQRLGGEGRVARKLRDLNAALGFEPHSAFVDEADGCDRRVADTRRELDEIVERLLGRGIEDAVGVQGLEARRFGPAVIRSE